MNALAVSWQAPSSDGGSPITAYHVEAYEGTTAVNAAYVAASATTAVLTGLPSGASFTAQVAAVNADGTGLAGVSNSVTPTGTGATYASTVLGDGASFYYRLDDTAGSGQGAADSSGSGHDATYQSGVGFGTGSALASDSDAALSPNGNIAAKYSAGTGEPVGAAARTVEGWVRTTNSGGQDVVSWGSAGTRTMFGLMLGSPGTYVGVVVGYDDRWFSLPRAIDDGTWHMLDATYDGNVTVTLYMDGQSVGRQTLAAPLSTQQTELDLSGSLPCCGPISGTNNGLDEVALYPSALTGTQIANHFNASGDTRPTAPTNVTATAGNDQATVSWTASAATVPAGQTAIAGYLATAYSGATAVNATSVAATATSAIISGLQGGTTYTVQVYALNSYGNGAVGTSSVVTPTGTSITYASSVLDDGASLYYRLDDTGPLLADSAGSHHAVAGAGTTRAIGGALGADPDGAIAPNGNVAGVDTGGAGEPVGAAARTVESWVRTTNSGGQDVVSWGSAGTRTMFGLMLGSPGTYVGVVVGYDDRWFSLPRAIDDGTWHLLDATYDGGVTVTLYLDGQIVGTQSLGAPLTTQQTELDVSGSIPCCGPISGTNNGLDEVAVYPLVLTTGQIANHYYLAGNSVPGAPSPPQNVRTVAGPGSTTVTWDPPAQLNGGGPITSYSITVFRPGDPVTYSVPAGVRRAEIPGLSGNTSYQASVSAVNATTASAQSTPSAVMSTSALSGARGLSSLGVDVGYADGARGAEYPSPWIGSPGVTFVGDTGAVDGGAIRFVNPTATAISLDSVSVDVGTYHFAPWPAGVTVPASGSLILAPYLTGSGFDTSETLTNPCTQSGLIPQIHVTSGGETRTYADTGQVLNTTGIDIGSCPPGTNEASRWVPIGSTPVSVCGCWRDTQHGDPVNSSSGSFEQRFTDLAIPGRGFPLDISRTYGSTNAGVDGPFGFGWSADLGMSLTAEPAMGDGMVSVRQEDGSPVTFTLTKGVYVAPPQVFATLTDNGDGTFTFTRNRREVFVFSGVGELLKHVNLNGEATSYTYDGSGRIGTISDAAGRTLTLSYDAANHVTKVVDSANRQVAYGYDANGNLTSVIDVSGGSTSFTYDANHQLLTMTDPRSGTVTNVYDSAGRVTTQTDAMGRITQFNYTPTTTTITDPLGHVEVDTYQNGLLTSKSTGSGAATWTYAYDPVTLAMTSVTDPDGHTTTSTYDAHGDLLTRTDALLRATTYTYDALGDITGVTDPLGATATYSYDAKGNLLNRSRPLVGASPAQTQTITYHHDNPAHAGDVTSVTDPTGKTTTYTYDAYGNRTGATDPLGNTTTTTYNPLGWATAQTTPKGNVSGCSCAAQYTTTFSYADPHSGAIDEFGDPRLITDPLGHATLRTYDADRNLVSAVDGNGNATTYTYDADNELTATTRADGTATRTDYNPDGTVLDQRDGKGNAILTYAYDSLGRATSTTDALGNATSYAYDGVGDVLNNQGPGGDCAAPTPTGCTEYTYDAANELTGITHSDGKTPNVSAIAYDADGQRTGMTDGTGTWGWNYDSLHRLTSVAEGGNGTVAYQYDLRNLVTQITYPGGHTVTRAYDDAARWTGTTDWLGNSVGFGYDPNGNLTTESFPANAAGAFDQDAFTFNAADQMSGSAVSRMAPPLPPATLISTTYTRDSNGQLLSDTSQSPHAGSYAYTPLDQLCYAGAANAACSTPPPGSTMYGYDAADNLVQNGAMQQAFNAADELCWTLAGITSANPCGAAPTSATLFTYDVNGNRTATAPASGSATTLGYDQANRLTSWQQGSASATYAYNGDGLRTGKTVGGTTESYVWDLAAGMPLVLTDGPTQYVYGPGGLTIEQVSGSTSLYYHHDQLGSTRELTDANGLIQATYTYDPYGNLTAATGSAANAIRFAGQYQDSESGLYYLRARYYDPATGQFLSRDPLVALTRTPYGYVEGNPLNAADPSGLFCFAFWDANSCSNPLTNAANAFVSSDFGKFANGWANGASGGLSSRVESLSANGRRNLAVDQCSGLFNAGTAAGVVTDVALVAGAARAAAATDSLATTPAGRPLTGHYLNETGPTRNIPGSVVDNTIDYGQVVQDLSDRTVYYDPTNDVTVVLSKTTGRIMSARRGSS